MMDVVTCRSKVYGFKNVFGSKTQTNVLKFFDMESNYISNIVQYFI